MMSHFVTCFKLRIAKQACTEIFGLCWRSRCKMYVVKSKGWLSKGCWLDLPRSKSWPVTVMPWASHLSCFKVSLLSKQEQKLFLNENNPWFSFLSRACNWRQDFVQCPWRCWVQQHCDSDLHCKRLLHLQVVEWFRPGGEWHAYKTEPCWQCANCYRSSPYGSKRTHRLHSKECAGVREQRSLQSHCELYVPDHTHTRIVWHINTQALFALKERFTQKLPLFTRPHFQTYMMNLFPVYTVLSMQLSAMSQLLYELRRFMVLFCYYSEKKKTVSRFFKKFHFWLNCFKRHCVFTHFCTYKYTQISSKITKKTLFWAILQPYWTYWR